MVEPGLRSKPAFLQVFLMADSSYNSLGVDEVAAAHVNADAIVSCLCLPSDADSSPYCTQTIPQQCVVDDLRRAYKPYRNAIFCANFNA